MKMHLSYLSIIFITLMTISCKGQHSPEQPKIEDNDQELFFDNRSYPLNRDDRDVVTNGMLDSKGNMWFTTLTEGVYKYDGAHFFNYTSENGLCSDKVNVVIEDREGLLWFGTSEGLCRYDGKDFSHFPLPQVDNPRVSPDTGLPSRPASEVLSLLQDTSGDFWLGTLAAGAYHFDGKTFTPFLKFKGRIHPDDRVYNNVIQSIVEDNDDNIWFTSQTHGGITQYDGKSFINYGLKDGLPDDMIFSSFKDRDGDLWFGTLDEGIVFYQDGVFKYYDESHGLNNNMVSCFYQDKSGKIWIGSFRESTVSWYDGHTFMSVPFDLDNKLVELRFITADHHDYIWFGGRYGLLYRYDGEELKDFSKLKKLKK